MAVAIQGLSPAMRQALAGHFTNQLPTSRHPATGTLVQQGERIALKGDPERRIPACLSCHDRAGANPAYPRLSGQPAAYLANQLRLFVKKTRGGGPFREVMSRAAAHLEDEDMRALAAYFAARNAVD